MILPSFGEAFSVRDTFQTTSLCDVSMQEVSVWWHWACPLWNTEDAAQAVAHACGAACHSKGAAVRCGEGVPCGNLPHSLREYGACRDYGAASPQDNCLFLSA